MVFLAWLVDLAYKCECTEFRTDTLVAPKVLFMLKPGCR